MSHCGGPKRRRTDSAAMAEDEETPTAGLRVDESPEHGMKVLQGLNQLKMEKVLCDVALIAEGREIFQHHVYTPTMPTPQPPLNETLIPHQNPK